MRWRAVTESGRVYESVSSGVKVSGDGYFHNPTLKVVDRGDLPSTGRTPEFWGHIRSLPGTDTPEVGKSVFLVTMSGAWRLSTRIESVEFLEDEVA